jgi:hypothetical protein
MADLSDYDSLGAGNFSGNIALNCGIPCEAAMSLVKAWFGVERKEQVYERTRFAYKRIGELIEASRCPVPQFDDPDDIDPTLMTTAIEGLPDPAVKAEIAGWLLCPPTALKTPEEQSHYRDAISSRVEAEMRRIGILEEGLGKLVDALEFEPDYELKYLLIFDRQTRERAS